MLRNITIGRYYNTVSPIHSLDCRTKLCGALLFIVGLFLVREPVWYIPCVLYVLLLYRAARVPLSFLFRGLRGFALLLVFTLLFQSTITEGHTLFRIGFLEVTAEGLTRGLRLGARIALMVIMASLLAYTTTPTQLAAGLEKSMGFLERFRVPVHEMAMMISIAFRFIPVFIEEIKVIMDAQTSRGVDFYEGGILRRMKKVFPIIIPLFVSAIRRSADLAMAMQARGYTDAAHRTRYRKLVYTKRDRAAYFVAILFFCFMLAARIFD